MQVSIYQKKKSCKAKAIIVCRLNRFFLHWRQRTKTALKQIEQLTLIHQHRPPVQPTSVLRSTRTKMRAHIYQHLFLRKTILKSNMEWISNFYLFRGLSYFQILTEPGFWRDLDRTASTHRPTGAKFHTFCK